MGRPLVRGVPRVAAARRARGQRRGARAAAGGAALVSSPARPPVLELRGLSVHHGHVPALARVGTALPAGRITCVLGENGSGKSTLVGVLSGLVRPDSGELLFDGRPVRFRTPRAARAAGIATVWPDLAVAPLLSVWRNFFLGAEPTRGFPAAAPDRPGRGPRDRGACHGAGRRPGHRPRAAGGGAAGRRAAEPRGGPRAALRRPRPGRRRADRQHHDQPARPGRASGAGRAGPGSGRPAGHRQPGLRAPGRRPVPAAGPRSGGRGPDA
ncbi:sugar ABC transporter ATP-binding protein [Geodermatophilus marinus]|nr:sugar ABC transporter ATP-binding protein [Geodermatophilus sp. LHW52908]